MTHPHLPVSSTHKGEFQESITADTFTLSKIEKLNHRQIGCVVSIGQRNAEPDAQLNLIDLHAPEIIIIRHLLGNHSKPNLEPLTPVFL